MATNTQSVIWTALPAGMTRDREYYRINLHVAPRLEMGRPGNGKLADFPAWLDWPRTLADARFTVQGLGGLSQPAKIEKATNADWPPIDSDGLLLPDSAVWQLLFPDTTPVISHKFDDFRGRDVLTYPLAALADSIEASYGAMAANGGSNLPRVSDLQRIDLFGSKRQKPSLEELLSLLRKTPVEKSGRAGFSISTMMSLLEAYHRPLAKPVVRKAKKRRVGGKPDPRDPHENTQYRTVDRVAMPLAKDFRVQIDFHRVVAAVGQHPSLMRLTGLIIPLLVPADNVTFGNRKLSVKVEWDGQGVVMPGETACITHTIVEDRKFIARSNQPWLVDGWLKAGDPEFALVQLDVDGAGLTIKNLATALPRMTEERQDDDAPRDPVARTGAPRLRTAGIQFAQTRRDAAIRGLFDGAGKKNDKALASAPVELFAEDLIKGWRVDVLDLTREKNGTGRGWQSLMRFDGHYELVGGGRILATKDEEAIARLAAAGTADPNADAQIRNILKASEALFGWTGWSLGAPPAGRAMLPDYTEVPGQKMLEEPGEAPNTVPPGMPLATAFHAHPGSLPVLRFGHRYQMRLRAADLAGHGPTWKPVDHLAPGIQSAIVNFGRFEPVETPVLTVIEGDPGPQEGESMPRAALRSMVTLPDTTKVRRNLHPARVSHRFAETHGVIDGPDGRPRADLYKKLVDRDAAFAEDQLATSSWAPDPTSPATDSVTSFTRSPEHGATPYPADPLCAGVAIRVTGLADPIWNDLHFVPFYGEKWQPDKPIDWLKDDSFQIVARNGGHQPGWDRAKRMFHVPLDKAERARLYISAVIPEADIEKMKMRELVIRSKGEEGWKKIEPLVRAGQHWMFTPNRMVELVHAVQKPLIIPSVATIHASRASGALAAKLSFRTPIHCKSTARLDIDGDWIDIDDSNSSGPVVRRVSGHAFDRKFYRLEAPAQLLSIDGEHLFPDTRARRVSYRAIATTRFREYMPLSVRSDPEQLSVTSPLQTIWIKSAARPPAPSLRYIVPTFGWSRSQSGNEMRSWRGGGGLRIYLDRPWFASGSNEMLAVCLPRGNSDPQQTSDKNFVTQWGADPAWISGKVETVAPAPTDFPLRIRSGNNLAYNATPETFAPVNPSPDGADVPDFIAGPYRPAATPVGTQVDIVPHAVGYDSERQLWYADIVINPHDTYFPFVRLALARFQPASVDGLHLSAAVLADFAQLAPDRLAISTPGTSPGQRLVRVHGVAPVDFPGLPRAGDFKVELQRLPVGADPDLGWVHQAQPVPPPPLGGTTSPGAVAFSRTARKSVRARSARTTMFSAAEKALLVEAQSLLDAGKFDLVLKRPDLVRMIEPPLIYESSVYLPARSQGERLRIMITEIETYHTGAERQPTGEEISRIVYAEAIEV